jgi:hypothetical protein
MNELDVSDLNGIEGGGWIADATRSVLCWFERNADAIGEAYVRVLSDPSNFM